MTNEEFQKLVLEKLGGLEQGQSKLEERQIALEQKISDVESTLTAKITDVESTLTAKITDVESTLTAKINDVESRLTGKINEVEYTLTATMDEVESTLTAKIDALDAKVERYGQIQQDDVKGLLEVMNKKLDRISSTQNIQGETINILALRQLQTESELAALKKAK